jgi:hypothetical protein
LAVVAKDVDGNNIADAVIVNCDPNDCVDEEGRLGDLYLGLLITNCNYNLGDQRMLFKIIRWSVQFVFYDAVSMYDIGRQFTAEQDEVRRLYGERSGKRRYSSVLRCRREIGFRKKDICVSNYAISQVSTVDCCERGCLQYFPRDLIKILWYEMHWGVRKDKATKCLDVHKCIQLCPEMKKKYVMVEDRKLCLYAWRMIHDIKERTFDRYASDVKKNKRPQEHGNLGKHKSSEATKQATATLRIMLEGTADMMPHKQRTLPTGERVGKKVLPTGTRWNHYLKNVNLVSLFFHHVCIIV